MLFNQAPADEEIMDPVTAEMVFFFLFTINCLLILVSGKCDFYYPYLHCIFLPFMLRRLIFVTF